jgi:uncharacterized protein YbaP (TraB family)
MRTFAFLLGFLFCSTLLPAHAEDPPVTDWTNTEIVVVRGRFEGPAFWHVAKDGADVWIMGTLNPLPEGLTWNEGRLKELITGARQVILPPVPDAGTVSTLWFAVTRGRTMMLADGAKLDDVLPGDLWTRFQTVRTAIGMPSDRLQRLKPVMAAMILVGDYDKANKLLSNAWTPTVEKLARQAHVRVRPIGELGVFPMLREILNLPQPVGINCFAAALHDIDNRRLHAVPVAEAWAAGDIAGIKAHYFGSSIGECLSNAIDVERVQEQTANEVMAAINDALTKPGKTVMLVDIGTLLRQRGVIERLLAAGLRVEGPEE